MRQGRRRPAALRDWRNATDAAGALARRANSDYPMTCRGGSPSRPGQGSCACSLLRQRRGRKLGGVEPSREASQLQPFPLFGSSSRVIGHGVFLSRCVCCVLYGRVSPWQSSLSPSRRPSSSTWVVSCHLVRRHARLCPSRALSRCGGRVEGAVAIENPSRRSAGMGASERRGASASSHGRPRDATGRHGMAPRDRRVSLDAI